MKAIKVVISGCSGGGKSTLLEALSARGFVTMAEPGRRIVAEEMRGNKEALPWVNLKAFALRAISLSESDLVQADMIDGLVFFDRGLVDAAVAYEYAGGTPYHLLLAGKPRYARRVFLTPPWPEIFVTDAERRNSFEEAKAEYQRLLGAYSELGYEICEVPKRPVLERVDFVLNELGVDDRSSGKPCRG